MPRLTIGQKAQRVLKFLMGVRNPRVAATLMQHGFSEADLREGLGHLAALTRMRLHGRAAPTEDPSVIAELDAFEDRWFPIAKASLERHFPQVAERFFANLTPTKGPEVAVSVATFLERLHALEDPNGGYGADAAAARELLTSRGLTGEITARAQAVLDELGVLRAEAAPPSDATTQTELESALWSWYLEWSGIARATIRERRLLRNLGFLQFSRTAREGEGDDLPALPDGGAASAPSLPVHGSVDASDAVTAEPVTA